MTNTNQSTQTDENIIDIKTKRDTGSDIISFWHRARRPES